MISNENLLNRYRPFCDLPWEVTKDIAKYTTTMSLKKRENFVPYEGTLYLMLTGKIVETIEDANTSNRLYIHSYVQGDLIGLFKVNHRLKVFTPSSLLKINHMMWKDLLRDYRVQYLEDQLKIVKQKITDMSFLSIEERLLKLHKEGGLKNISKQDVAYHLGCSREMVSRICTSNGIKVALNLKSD